MGFLKKSYCCLIYFSCLPFLSSAIHEINIYDLSKLSGKLISPSCLEGRHNTPPGAWLFRLPIG